MKKAFIIFILFVLSVNSFGQQSNRDIAKTKQDYLQKSKDQKTLAWILLSTGAVSSATGLIIGNNNFYEELGSVITTGQDDKDYKAGEFLFYTGLVLIGGSIPFFIAAGKNRKKAMNMSFRFQPSPYPPVSGLAKKKIPALTLQVHL